MMQEHFKKGGVSSLFFCQCHLTEARSKGGDIWSEDMSLFERKNEEELKRRNLDESVEIRAVIASAVTVESHTVGRHLSRGHLLRFRLLPVATCRAASCYLITCRSAKRHI
jgi:hypothetical protein